MITTKRTNRALQIQPTGLLLEQHIPADSGESIRDLIGCRTFDVISLEDRIDLWVDDEGLLQAEPVLNLLATILAHALGVQTAIFGTAVALSVNGTTGETQCRRRDLRSRAQRRTGDGAVLETALRIGGTRDSCFCLR